MIVEVLRQLEKEARTELDRLTDPKLLDTLRVKYLGRKGLLASFSSKIPRLPHSERPSAGQEMNRIKKILEDLFLSKERSLSSPQASVASGTFFDPSMPGTFHSTGTLHPLTQVILEITGIFERLGFCVVEGPEVETEYHNFEALNIPLEHPARDLFDTFYLENGRILRSQTSTVQIRVMETKRPPLKIIAPGKVYRPDATDATHSFMFHQIEGLCVDKGIGFSHLKGVLMAFAKEFFGSDTECRFRPHFFPFTEPSAEMDIFSKVHNRWLEILGAGLVHPKVLKNMHVNPEIYTGFAFGMGVERMAMLRYGIEDIRTFFENDIRFLKQF